MFRGAGDYAVTVPRSNRTVEHLTRLSDMAVRESSQIVAKTRSCPEP